LKAHVEEERIRARSRYAEKERVERIEETKNAGKAINTGKREY